MDSPVIKEKKLKKDKKDTDLKVAAIDGGSTPSPKREKSAKEKKEKKSKTEVSVVGDVVDDSSPIKKDKVKRKKSPSSPATPSNLSHEVKLEKPKRIKKAKEKEDTSPGGAEAEESPLGAAASDTPTPRPKRKKAPPAPSTPLLEGGGDTPATSTSGATVGATATPSPKKKRSKPKTQLELELENMPLPTIPSHHSSGGGLDAFLTRSSDAAADLDIDLIAALGMDTAVEAGVGSGAAATSGAATAAADDDQDVMDMLNNLTNFEKRSSKPKPKGKKAPKRATSASPTASPEGGTDGGPTPPASPRPKGKKKMMKKAPPTPAVDGENGDDSPSVPSPVASPPGVRPARKKRPSPSPGKKASVVSPPAALSAPPPTTAKDDDLLGKVEGGGWIPTKTPPPLEVIPMVNEDAPPPTHLDNTHHRYDSIPSINGEEVRISLADFIPEEDGEGGGEDTRHSVEGDPFDDIHGDDVVTEDVGGNSTKLTISTSHAAVDDIGEDHATYVPPSTATTKNVLAPMTPITTPTSRPLSRVSSFGSTSRRDRVVTFSNVLDDRTTAPRGYDDGVLEPIPTPTPYQPPKDTLSTYTPTPTTSYRPSGGGGGPFVLEPLERSSSAPPTPVIAAADQSENSVGGSPSSMLLSPNSVSATIDRGVKAHTTGAANLARTPTRQVNESTRYPSSAVDDDVLPSATRHDPPPSFFGGGGGVLEEIVTSAPHTRSTSPTAYEEETPAIPPYALTPPSTSYYSPPPPPKEHNDEDTLHRPGAGGGGVGGGGGEFEHFFKDAYDGVHVSLSPDQQRSPSLPPPPPPPEEDEDDDFQPSIDRHNPQGSVSRDVSPTVLAIIEEEPYNRFGDYAPDMEEERGEYDTITVSALSSPNQRSVRGTAPDPFGLSPLLPPQDHPPPAPHLSGMYHPPQRGAVPYAVSDSTSIECSEEPMRKSNSPPSSYPDYKQLGPWPVLHRNHSPPAQQRTSAAAAPTLDHITQAAVNKGAESNLNTTFNEFLTSFTKLADTDKPDPYHLKADRLHPMHSAHRHRNMEATTAPLFRPRLYPTQDEDLIELLRDALQPLNVSSPTAKTAMLDPSLTHSWGVLKKKLRNSLVKQSKLRSEIRQWDSSWGLGDTLKAVRSDGGGEDASDPLRAAFVDGSPMSTSSAQLLLRTKTALKRRRVATRAQKQAIYDAFLFMLAEEQNGSMIASTSPEDMLSNLFGITEVVSLSP